MSNDTTRRDFLLATFALGFAAGTANEMDDEAPAPPVPIGGGGGGSDVSAGYGGRGYSREVYGQ